MSCERREKSVCVCENERRMGEIDEKKKNFNGKRKGLILSDGKGGGGFSYKMSPHFTPK